jgi:glycosyltransferase involved in cell wall biosynthesis
VALLVEAFARVRARRPDARLVLVRPTRSPGAGTGPGFDGPGVEWVDQDHRPAVLAGLYGEAWVSALPAVDEAFGLALVESLACGTPVVGYAQGGIPEVLDRPGIGTLLRRLDAEELAHALELTLELAGDPLTAIRCRERAEDFSAERSSDRYLALYRELTGAACAS